LNKPETTARKVGRLDRKGHAGCARLCALTRLQLVCLDGTS
jgi:hypothetical protein